MADMHLTARALNRTTLARQLLIAREPLDPVDAVGRILAVQAQEPVSPYVALHNRVAAFDPVALDRAFSSLAIVKASLMRITLHAVTLADYPALHEAMQGPLRAARLNDRRFLRTGLTARDADALIPEVLEVLRAPRSNAEMEAWLDQRVGETPRPGIWWAMRHYGPFVHAPNGSPWTFGPRPVFTGAPVLERPAERAEAIRQLALRYLEAFGPATIADIGRFSMISRGALREALEPLAAALVRRTGPAGEELVDAPGAVVIDEALPAPPRLMAMWDSLLLAHDERGRFVPPAYRSHISRSNGDTLPTLLVDGLVAGVWRPTAEGVEATAFHRLSDDAWEGIEAEVGPMLRLLRPREPVAYGRYARWWPTLPAAEVRVLRD
jgi:hypothetical protein